MKDATLRQAEKILSLFGDTPLEQVQAILGSGLFADLRDGNIAQVNRNEFRKILGLNSLTLKREIFLNTMTVPATAERFIARNEFVVKSTRVKICWLSNDFKSWFLGKIEEPIGETTLRYWKLRKGSLDSLIIAKLGGRTKAETTLAEMFSLMKRQRNGEKGVLLTNGLVNIFYIHDINGVLRAVSIWWDDGGWWGDGGWRVGAYPIEDPNRWVTDFLVFSRYF